MDQATGPLVSAGERHTVGCSGRSKTLATDQHMLTECHEQDPAIVDPVIGWQPTPARRTAPSTASSATSYVALSGTPISFVAYAERDIDPHPPIAQIGAAGSGLPFTDILAQFTHLGSAALIYCILVAIVALAAVFSTKSSRRKSAVAVLQLLVPHRRPPGTVANGGIPRRSRSRQRQRGEKPEDVTATRSHSVDSP